MKKRCLAIVFYLLSGSMLWSQQTGINFIEDKSWKELLSQAAEKDKLIFLDCYTTWCGPCKAMARDVFPLPEVGEFMNAHFINTKFDMEKGEGIGLHTKYKKFIPGFPTYLLINARGEVVHQVAGYNAADKFIAKIKDGIDERTWIAYSHKYAAGQRDWGFIQTYLSLLEDAYQSAAIKEVTAEALPRLTVDIVSKDSAAYRIFRKYWTEAESPVLFTVLSSPGIYRRFKDPEKELNEWGGRLYKRAVDTYAQASMHTPKEYNAVKAQQLIDDLQKLHVNGRENMIALLLLSQAIAKNDGTKFLAIYNSAVQFGHLRYDRTQISNWTRYLAGKTTDKKMLQQYLACISLQEESPTTAPGEIRNYAFILEKLGDNTKAKEYYTKADKKEAELKEKYKSFLETK